MRYRTTVILAAALALVAAYFFLVEERGRKEKEADAKEARRIFPYIAEAVRRAVLLNPQGERIEMERAGAGWLITAPALAAGDATTINSVLGQIVPGRKVEEIANVADLADFGLRKPFATLILSRGDSLLPDTLFAGDETPTETTCFLRLGSSRTVIVSGDLTRNVLNKSLYHLREKAFLGIVPEEVSALSVAGGAGRLDLIREGAYWWFRTPRARADRLRIDPYVAALAGSLVYEFAREDTADLAPYGFGRGTKRLEIRHSGRVTRISFGGTKDDLVYAIRSGLDKVVLLKQEMIEPFAWTAENLRAMEIAFFASDSVGSFTFETPDTAIGLRRSGTEWRIAGPDSLAVKSWEVTSLLRRIAATRFDRIIEEPLPSSNDPRLDRFLLRIAIADRRGRRIDIVTIAPGRGDGLYAASSTANALGVLPRKALDGIRAIFARIGS